MNNVVEVRVMVEKALYEAMERFANKQKPEITVQTVVGNVFNAGLIHFNQMAKKEGIV